MKVRFSVRHFWIRINGKLIYYTQRLVDPMCKYSFISLPNIRRHLLDSRFKRVLRYFKVLGNQDRPNECIISIYIISHINSLKTFQMQKKKASLSLKTFQMQKKKPLFPSLLYGEHNRLGIKMSWRILYRSKFKLLINQSEVFKCPTKCFIHLKANNTDETGIN